MKKKVFLFPGQGSQYPGMGSELAEKFPGAKIIYEIGSDILGFDLRKAIDEGDAASLAKTEIAQPAIFAASLIAAHCAKENGIVSDGSAGHSLGEYAAMVETGILTAEAAFTALKHRSRAMACAGEKNPGAMSAVIGFDTAEIEKICAEISGAGDYVLPVNYNSPVQTVIAGTIGGIEKAETALKAKGARKIVRLDVSAAFHSALMKDAAEEFRGKIAGLAFGKPGKPFYSNLTGGVLDVKNTDMPEYLAKHMVSPVKFTSELRETEKDGFGVFIELGPKTALTAFVKKTLPDAVSLNIEDMKTLDKTLNTIKELE